MTPGRRFRLLAAALVASSCSRPADLPQPSRHVVLISIGGLLPEDLERPRARGVTLPALEALARSGSVATSLLGVFPGQAVPAHATIATGVLPARHGVVQNTLFALPEPRWRFDAAELRAPALWDRASAAGLTTAAVAWPLTRGARIDFLIPDVEQYPAQESWLDVVLRHSTPGLVDDVTASLGGFGPEDNRHPELRDRFTAAAAVRILNGWRPDLTLVRFVEAELARQIGGPESEAAEAALRRIDGHVADLVAAVRESGFEGRTTFVVCGDHGVRSVRHALQPNVVLRRHGLLETGRDGNVRSGKAAAHGSTIRLADPTDAETAARVLRVFRDLESGEGRGTFRLVERAELDALGADSDALFALEPASGYTVTRWLTNDTFVAEAPLRGAHGFLPSSPGMPTALVLSGSGVRVGGSLPVAREVDIAPTVARLLGFEMPGVAGAVLTDLLR